MRIIQSKNNPEVMFAASLLSKKGRVENGLFIAEGEKLFREASEPKSRKLIDRVYLLERESERLGALVEERLGKTFVDSERCIVLSESAFAKISTENSPQGIITVLKSLDIFKKCTIIDKVTFSALGNGRAIALASVRDPGNLGAIIRSAVAFGFETVVLSDDCAELGNPKTVRAAMGGLFKIRFLTVADFPSFISAARASGRRVLAAELRDGAIPISDANLKQSDIVMVGNEGHGIPPAYAALCDRSIYIPISPDSESLNCAVAASLLLWEISKS